MRQPTKTHYCPVCPSRPALEPSSARPGERNPRVACPTCSRRYRVKLAAEVPSTGFVSTDGGRAVAGFAHETKDCSVRAYALAMGVSYASAHAAHRELGRKDRSGTPVAVSLRLLGQPTEHHHRRVTFARWLAVHRVGTWIVHTSNHALCVKDGVQHDNGAGLYRPRTRIERAWRIA